MMNWEHSPALLVSLSEEIGKNLMIITVLENPFMTLFKHALEILHPVPQLHADT